ncbi:hypothetical protein B0I12_001722 [Microbacterium hydrothermale]|uniref:hypothetical protein n=1 Tax=Microbacterium hydrothermale TaxID=857427 RepID=UPI0022273EEB|nr:hypothetical protein [Microbacterium hydrothermale]MCW2164587.1 hypothetical protein [Microbacterium hydrothermale]
MTISPRRSVPLSMWLCTGAVVAFAAIALFDLDGLEGGGVAALGLALVVAGGVRLGVELVGARAAEQRDAPQGPRVGEEE